MELCVSRCVVCVDTRCWDYDGPGHRVSHPTSHKNNIRERRERYIPGLELNKNTEHNFCLMNFHQWKFFEQLTVAPSFLIYGFIVLNIL